MHTKKRHQNMLQDLNRKLHHAEKDRESPASDSKVKPMEMWRKCREKNKFWREKTETKTEAMKVLKKKSKQTIKPLIICLLNDSDRDLQASWIRMYFLPSFSLWDGVCLQGEVTKQTTVWVFIYNLTFSNFTRADTPSHMIPLASISDCQWRY